MTPPKYTIVMAGFMQGILSGCADTNDDPNDCRNYYSIENNLGYPATIQCEGCAMDEQFYEIDDGDDCEIRSSTELSFFLVNESNARIDMDCDNNWSDNCKACYGSMELISQ